MKEGTIRDAGLSVKETRLLHDLNVKKLQLHWLLQITKAINYDLPARQLFDVYQVVLREHLQVGKAVLFLKDSGWEKMVEYGCHVDLSNEDPDLLFSTAVMDSNHAVPWVRDFETIIPVYHNDKPLAYALVGDFPQDENNFREVLPYIHTITNIIVVAIENKRLTRESIQQAAMGRELELAARMQAMLFPQQLPSNNLFEMAATYLPHQQVGGDYYDYIQLSPHEAIVCMADISGKGISAALLMSNFQANLHALIKLGLPLTELIYELNACVNKSAKGEKFITFFIAQINNQKQTLHYINAGHNPPILMDKNRFTLLEAGTTGLGMFELLPFINEGTVPFPENAILFCYTDGITDIEDHDGNFFGVEKIQEILLNHAGIFTMNDLHLLFVDAFHKFKGPLGFTDDITMLSCKSIGSNP